MFWIHGAPLIVGVTFMLIVAGVILLWPLSRRLGQLLEVMVLERRREVDAPAAARHVELLASLEQRLTALEERQEFTEKLLTAGADNDHRAPAPRAAAQPRRAAAETG